MIRVLLNLKLVYLTQASWKYREDNATTYYISSFIDISAFWDIKTSEKLLLQRICVSDLRTRANRFRFEKLCLSYSANELRLNKVRDLMKRIVL